MADAPTSYQVQRFAAEAHEKLTELQEEHGLILDDSDAVLDALTDEGLDGKGLLIRLGRAALNAKSLAAGAKARMDDLKARRDRFEKLEATYRGLAQALMDTIGLTALTDPEFSIHISIGRPAVHVTDIDALPDAFVSVTITKTADKTAIKKRIDAGEDVRGAVLTNPSRVLTIRSR